MNLKPPSPTARRYIYGIAAAGLPLLIAYGVLSQEHAPLWLALIGAILIPGMAWANTTPPPSKEAQNDQRPPGR